VTTTTSTTTTIVVTTSTTLAAAEDTGFAPPDNPTRRCEDAIAKSLGALARAILRWHIRAADAAFEAQPFDEEGCEASAKAR
jgi:hypothetical protein